MKKCENSDEDNYCCLQGLLCTSQCDRGPTIIRFQGEPSVVTTIGVTATASQILNTGENFIGAGSASQTSPDSRATEPSAVRETGSHSRTGLKIGVGVGVPLGVIALVLAAYVIWKRTRRSKPRQLPLDNGHTYRDKSMDRGQYEVTQSPAHRMESVVIPELE